MDARRPRYSPGTTSIGKGEALMSMIELAICTDHQALLDVHLDAVGLDRYRGAGIDVERTNAWRETGPTLERFEPVSLAYVLIVERAYDVLGRQPKECCLCVLGRQHFAKCRDLSCRWSVNAMIAEIVDYMAGVVHQLEQERGN